MTEQKYAISEYPDAEKIYTDLKNLINQPIRPIREDKMQEVLGYFDRKCKRSKEITDEAKKFIPGGVQHNLAFYYPFPIAIEKANGAHKLWIGWQVCNMRSPVYYCVIKDSRGFDKPREFAFIKAGLTSAKGR